MDKAKVEKLSEFYSDFLYNNCISFWLENSLDYKHGGYLTCLDRSGAAYSTNKAIWFQGRGTWLYSRLYNTAGRRAEWLEAAKLGYKFLAENGFGNDERAFLEVTRDGQPVRKADDIFSEAFAVIAFAEYYRASGDRRAIELALQTYKLILDTIGIPEEKAVCACVQDIRFERLAVPMILLSVIQILREAINIPELDNTAAGLVKAIFRDFARDDVPVFVEFSGDKEKYPGSLEGCHIKPGHSIETAWFIIHEGIYSKDDNMVARALDVLEGSLVTGWDKEYGGIIYHTDTEGIRGEDGDWHLKLWWPQTEALYAALLAYYVTGDPKYENWFDRIHEWSFGRFADPVYGEWYSDLYRDGTVRNNNKGSLWKGPFHLPRAILFCLDILEKMKEKFEEVRS